MIARLITTAQLRAYLGVNGAALRRMRHMGVVPDPIPGTRRYDFEAVKRALDRVGTSQSTMVADEQELIARGRNWGRSA